MPKLTVAQAALRSSLGSGTITRLIRLGLLKAEAVPMGKRRLYLIDLKELDRTLVKRPVRGNPNFGPDFWKNVRKRQKTRKK